MQDARARFFATMEQEMVEDGRFESERTCGTDIDIDFDITDSGRTVAHMTTESERDSRYMMDDMDYSMAGSSRTDDQMLVGLTESDRDELVKTFGSNQIAANSGGAVASNSISNAALYPNRSAPQKIPIPNDSRQRPRATSTSSGASAARSIPVPQSSNKQSSNPPPLLQPPSSEPSSSQGSSGSAFLSSVLNPTAAGGSALSGAPPLSHTPPTVASSYEASHFGKRARSGSVSGRIHSATDYLEERGLLDRHTKGILKDLIIIGDEELQNALDRYDAGDPSVLEDMIRSGGLQDRLPKDLDILGDLDLDFLTVHDNGMGDMAGGNIESLPQHRQQCASVAVCSGGQQQQEADGVPSPTAVLTHPGALQAPYEIGTAGQPPPQQSKPIQVPLPLPPPTMSFPCQVPSAAGAGATAQRNRNSIPVPSGAITSSSPPQQQYDDGIGELEFAGDLVTDQGDYLHLQPQSFGSSRQEQEDSAAASPTEASLSEYERRLRSNSLFTALFNESGGQANGNDPPPLSSTAGGNGGEARYEQWMNPPRVAQQGTTSNPVQAGIRISNGNGNGNGNPANGGAVAGTTVRGGGIGASLEAERKRREKQEKKERKAREKQERKNKREQEKKKAAAEEEAEEHVPGSGRPRSLSDPNLRTSVDVYGLTCVDRPEGWVGAYSPESRRVRIERFLEKRNHRVWTKTVKYDVRKNFADSRLRVKGRFVKKEDELMMRELMSLT